MQGNQIVSQIISRLMNSGFKQILRNIFSSANPEQMAMGFMNQFVGNDPQKLKYWKMAQEMTSTGNAREKTKNFFAERDIDIENVVDGVVKEVQK